MASGNAPTIASPKTEAEQSMSIGSEEGPLAANDLPINAVPENKPELSGYLSPEEGLEQASGELDATEPTIGIDDEGSLAVNLIPINAFPEMKPELSGYLTSEEGPEQADDVSDATEANETGSTTTDEATGDTGEELSAAAVAMPAAVGLVAALAAGLEDSSPLALSEEESASGLEEPLQSAAHEPVPVPAASVEESETSEDTATAAPTVLEQTTALVKGVPEVKRRDQVAATVKEAGIGDMVEVSVIDTFVVKVRCGPAQCCLPFVDISSPLVKWLLSTVFWEAGFAIWLHIEACAEIILRC